MTILRSLNFANFAFVIGFIKLSSYIRQWRETTAPTHHHIILNESTGDKIEIPRHGCIDNKCLTSLLTMISAFPAAAKAKYLSSLGSRHSRTISVGSTRSAAMIAISRIDCRRPMETNRSNLGRDKTSRYSASTSAETINRFGAVIARSNARSGLLSALSAAETKLDASNTTINPAAQPAKPPAPRRYRRPSARSNALPAWPRR